MKESIAKFKQYLIEVWNEVKPKGGKVAWPSRDEVKGSTVVVLIVVFIVGLYLGVIDQICAKLLDIFSSVLSGPIG